MRRQAQGARRYKDEQFGLLKVGRVLASQQADSRNRRGPWQSASASHFIRLKDSGHNRSFIFTQADRLLDVAIAEDGNPVDGRPRKPLNVELKLQSDLIIVMKVRRGFYLQSQILVLGGWIAGLRRR